MRPSIMARTAPHFPGDGLIDEDGGHMKRAVLVALGTGALISSAAAIGIGMTHATPGMTPADFRYGVETAREVRAAALARCGGLRAGERELCRTEADAEAAVRVADLEADFQRTQEAARNAQKVRIDSRYQVRRAQCQALGGFRRDKCLVSAHAERGRALLDVTAPYAVRYQP
jgi:hypothetical protein